MSLPFCAIYTGSGTSWPVRAYPASSFPRGSAARSRDSAKAWNFFEQVEAYDAAIRVKYASLGGFVPSTNEVVSPAPWYLIKTESDRILYRRGMSLHRQLCPSTDWTPQRMLGIPTVPFANVFPGACIIDSGGSSGPRIMGSRAISSPALSAISGSLREVSLLGSSVPNSHDVSTASSSRRNSISHT